MTKSLTVVIVTISLFAGSSLLNAQFVHCEGADSARILSFTSIGTYYFASAKDGLVFKSTNSGATWTPMLVDSSGKWIYSVAVVGNSVFAAIWGGGVVRSTNFGQSWVTVNTGLTNLAVWCLHTTSTNLLFAGTYGGGVFMSANYGNSWTPLNTGLTETDIWSLGSTGSTYVFAGGYQVFRSTNGGANWSTLPSGPNGDYINAVAAYGGHLYAATQTKFNYSDDYGNSWHTPHTFQNIQWFAPVGSSLFIGDGGGGVYLTKNYGVSIYYVGDGLPNNNLTALGATNTYVLLGLQNGGIWRRPISEMITAVDDQQDAEPLQFTLAQNYPNPFNPVTTFSFVIGPAETGTSVSLKVYDLLGEEVATIVNEKLPPGEYTRSWDASNAPSGVYYYTLRYGNQTETRKTILLR